MASRSTDQQPLRRHSRNRKQSRIIYALTGLAVLFSAGHHLDHVIRGNHIGWPLTEHVNAFTISLGIYPTLLVAILLYRAGRIGPGVWALLSGNGAVFVAGLHFGPLAVEPPHEIIDLYPSGLGWFWFVWLILFVAVLVATCAVETYLWASRRSTVARRTVSSGVEG